MPKNKTAPALGERAAVGGYQKQYEYSACTLYRLMQEGDLAAISVAHPEAGIFDDLVIRTSTHLCATQVKTQSDAKWILLANELSADGFCQALATAWTSLRARHNRVRIKFIFAGLFSIHDRSLASTKGTGNRHSAAFAKFVSRSDLDDATIDGSIWAKTLRDWEKKSGLNADQFLEFLNGLELCDLTELQRHKIENFPPADRPRIAAIRDLIPQLVAVSGLKEHWTESELVEKLGWQTKLAQQNLHEFPVPADFQANEKSESAILAALQSNESGYVALVGPPGAGKSTLLQRAIFSTAEFGVVRYLAFLPDHRHGLGRAEAASFLNDLIVELKGQGFGGSRFTLDNLAGLRSELAHQLQQASEFYRESGRKTVIVVDGLDHVPREEKAAASFLRELPAAHSVPQGVLFVLGTQSLDLADLHRTIVQQGNQKQRRINIDELPREAIYQMAAAGQIPDFVDRDEIYDACSGHPLSARYFIQALQNVGSREEAKRILSHADGLGRSLEEIYQRVWSSISASGPSKDVLALLARAEGALLPSQLANAVSEEAVQDVLDKAGFLLKRNEEGRRAIFHNSFRLFIAADTGKRFGEPDIQKDRAYNAALANIASRAANDDPQRWMQLRYLARAGDNQGVLRIGVPSYFRASLAAFRPASDISVDLRLTYAAVKPTRDRTLLLNKLLIEKEIEYRQEAVSQLDLIGLFFDLGNIELAVRHALEDGSPGDGWLRLVDHLWENGQQELARQVFEANEPLELLFGRNGIDLHHELDPALNWIQRAHRFRSVARLTSLIDTLRGPPDGRQAFRQIDDIRKDLRFRLALGIILDKPEIDVETLAKEIGLSSRSIARLHVEAAHCSDSDAEALSHLEAARSTGELVHLHPSWRRSAALLGKRLGADEIAQDLASPMILPRFYDDRLTTGRDDLEAKCQAVFESVVLTNLLKLAPTEVAPPERRRSSPVLENIDPKLRELGTLRATVTERDSALTTASLKSIIHFFAHAKPERGDYEGFKIRQVLGWVADKVVGIAIRMDPESAREIVAFVDEKLSQGGNNLSWSREFRLRFAKAVFAHDGDRSQAEARLTSAEAAEADERTPQEVVEFRAEFARASHAVGLKEAAYRHLGAMHDDTFGYWLRAKKEPQYEFWAWSYLKACDATPPQVREYASVFGQFILGMDQTEGDETAQRIVGDLLDGAGACPPVMASLVGRLVDSDLTRWAQLADAALAAIAKHSPDLAAPALLTFSRLVVPFIDGRCDKCVSACLRSLSPGDREEPIRALVDAVARWCPPSRRSGVLRQVLDGAPEAEAMLREAIRDAEGILRSFMELEYGPRGPTEDSRSTDYQASSLQELLDLGEGISDYGDGIDYSYARAAEKLIEASTKDEIDSFLAARLHLEGDARLLVAIGLRMLQLGHAGVARTLLPKAEALAFAGHWSTFFGGQKLAVQDLRVALDGPAGRERGFDVLVDELAAGQTYGTSLFLNLDRVLEQISVHRPYEAFWRETEEHLKQYREYRLATPVLPKRDIKSHSDLLAYVISLAFGFSCPEILIHARAATPLVLGMRNSERILQSLCPLLLSQPDGAREAAALVVRNSNKEHLRNALTSFARDWVKHPDFIVSAQARSALERLGEALPDEGAADLPHFYRLAPSGSPQATNFEPPPGLEPGRRPVWSDDPWTWTSLLGRQFRRLANATGIPLELLRRRCAEFMRRQGGRQAFGPEVDEAIERALRRMDLPFNYTRALPMASFRAFGMVLNELVAAGEVHPHVIPVLWDLIGGPSVSGAALTLDRRPEWIDYPAFPRRQNGGISREEWISTTEGFVYSALAPNLFVLAEQTFFKARVWREVVEAERFAVPAPMKPELRSVPRVASLDIWQPLYEEAESGIVCRVGDSLFGDLTEPTLAICPYVARELSWEALERDPFEWRDASRALVAKTLRWVDGTDSADRFDSELFGRGQAILLSQSGREQIERLHGPLARSVEVTHRIILEEGEITERTVTARGDVATR